MKTSALVAAIAAVTTTACAVPATSGTSTTNDCTPQFEYAMGNLSYMFGWQLAGSALSDNQLDVTCANISNTGHGRWAAEGLIPAYIQEPVCNSSNASPNATTAVPWALQYSTGLFITQLTHSFNASDATVFEYLCTNLRFLELDGFYLNDARVLNVTCALAGLQLPPRPEGPIVSVNTNATTAYANHSSVLYGLMFASSAETAAELALYCAHAPEYVSSLSALTMNGTLVESTICGVSAPMTTAAGKAAIEKWTTLMFITIVENVSSVDGWLDWLCASLVVDSMNNVGLDGQAVHKQVCADAQA